MFAGAEPSKVKRTSFRFGLEESKSALTHIYRGATLHDIGKIGIPDSILHENGSLAHEEQKLMRMHPVYAYELLQPIPCLRPTLDIPYWHHEKWDGTGYPRGLKGEQIPFTALKKADNFRKELNLSRSYCVQVLNMTYHDT